MNWLLGPWPMLMTSVLWLLQAVAYAFRKDWGHAIMAVSYAIATCGLVYAWFYPTADS